MKKIAAFIGVGVLSLAFMSSTCSIESGKAPKGNVDSMAMAPAPGIAFKKKSFDAAKEEAKKEGKLIFIDAYTDWCGPCKRMAATSFKDAKVGDLYNKSFINLKIDMEKGEGPEIARRFGVKAYPTLLIVDGNGKLVKQVVGMKSSAQLIAFANSVL